MQTDTSRPIHDMGLSALLSALRLGSGALPIGAFAYSQGLESAVASGAVRDPATAESWISGVLECSVLALDVPFLVAMLRAWTLDRNEELTLLSDRLFARRTTHELREEERQLGAALFRLLAHLGVQRASAWARAPRATLAAAFALAASSWRMPAIVMAATYCYSWCEGQVGAATRLVPLGQSAAQSVLTGLLGRIDAQLPFAMTRAPEDACATAPGQNILTMMHETQHSRLFRS